MGRAPNVPPQLTVQPFSLAEARTAGLSFSALRGKSWQRVGARLYRWRGASDDTWDLLDAFRRTLPASAVFVGRTAAWMHNLDLQPANPIQVAVKGIQSRAGLEVRRSDTTGETVEIRGIPSTTLHRTLLDLCAWSTPIEALIALDMAVLAGVVGLHEYALAVRRRVGAARLRSLAAIAAPAESPMETRLRWLLIKAGLPTPEVQSDLYDSGGQFVGRADLYYPFVQLVIEFDGGNHRDRLVSDDRRQNSLVSAGYRILRFTATDLYGRPDAVVAQVRAYFSGR
jgi:hypothetical protein